MHNVINELKAERDLLRARLAKVEAAIDQYEDWARSVAELISGETTLPIKEQVAHSTTEQTPIAAFEEKVRAILDQSSAPLKRTEVYEELTREGVVVGGKDPLNTVASRLSRMKGITNLRGFGYWAADRPYTPAGYPKESSSAEGLFAEAKEAATEDSSPGEGTQEAGRETP